MQITMIDQTWMITQLNEIHNNLFERIDKKVQESDYMFSHLIIDDVEVYEDHVQYITERFDEIQDIQVKLMTYKEHADELIISANTYLSRSIPYIRQLANQFYTNPSTKEWDEFRQLIEGVDWLIQMMKLIEQYPPLYIGQADLRKWAEQFNENMKQLLAVMEDNDFNAIADLLTYEVLPAFEGLHVIVSRTMDNEVVRHDLS